MKSRKFIHFSAAVLLVLAVWWFAFTIALAEGDREFLLSVPIFLLLASIGLVFLAWKRSISGMLVLALPIFGLSVLLAVDLWSHHSIPAAHLAVHVRSGSHRYFARKSLGHRLAFYKSAGPKNYSTHT